MNARTDIAVVGSGAAGIAAAVTAARAGRDTILFDQHSAAGGTGGFSGLTTTCGLFDDAGKFLNEGFAREFAEAIAASAPRQMGKVWVQPYRPEKFREVAVRLFATTPNLRTRWSEPIGEVVCEAGRIVSLNGHRVGAVIDCSGTAEVARAVGAECLATDDTTQAPAVFFPLHHVTRPLPTAAEVAQVLLPFTVARRAGRMIVGEYVLTGADVLAGRKFSDAVARGAWPIEQWNAQGVTRLRYLPPGAHYEIPARSLRAARVTNLFMAGKTISADVDAIASARVMGGCLATGAAAGNLAVASLASLPT
ncbi:MAG: FAD-dependent oxidoreductase [Verrucomicrobia bacterium]|nr:FAD-dependent oxidoreductase [Verrucomicrobiota bacterium]